MQSLRVLALTLIAIIGGSLLGGCNSRHQSRVINDDGVTETNADGQIYLADVDDFDLSIVMGVLKRDQDQDSDSLMKLINDPDSGINNVDLDDDEVIDFIAVQEEALDNGKRFNFVAIASKGNGDKATVASIDLTLQPSGALAVNGFYPSHIHGWQYSYYPDVIARPSGFYLWALRPRPVLVLQGPGYYTDHFGWTRRRVIDDVGVRRSTVSTFRSKTSVSPVQRRQEPPQSFKRPAASRIPTGLEDAARHPTNRSKRLSDRTQTKSYQATDPSRGVGKGGSFAPRPPARTPSTPPPVVRTPSSPGRTPGFGSAPRGPSMSRGGRR